MNALLLDNLVWGGDRNHAMQGREYVGTVEARAAIQAALTGRRLKPATEDSPRRISGLAAIDHIAVPDTSEILGAKRFVAEDSRGNRLSDHGAYVVGATSI